MKRLLVIAALALAGCETSSGIGEANYDSLARLRADCVSKGGELKLKENYNANEMASYQCVRK
jgi:hypothetical protein